MRRTPVKELSMSEKRKEEKVPVKEPIKEADLEQISGGYDGHRTYAAPRGPIAWGPPPIKNHPA